MDIKYPVTGEDVALNELTPETIAHGSFPVRALLYNSVFLFRTAAGSVFLPPWTVH